MIKRRPQRLDIIFAREPVYFVTFCTRDRRRILDLKKAQAALEAYAQRGINEFGTVLGRYVIMPDHIHLFVRGSLDFVLVQWMRMLKRSLSGAIHEAAPHWQSGFFDHLIRHSESYTEKWEYVRLNPVRAGLVKNCQEWPWQGEIERLEA